MDPSSLEIFCKNAQCGDPEIHTSMLAPSVESRRFRRMNYMGSANFGFGKRLLLGIISDENEWRPPMGEYHLYQCPVCGAERFFVKRGDLLSEVVPP